MGIANETPLRTESSLDTSYPSSHDKLSFFVNDKSFLRSLLLLVIAGIEGKVHWVQLSSKQDCLVTSCMEMGNFRGPCDIYVNHKILSLHYLN